MKKKVSIILCLILVMASLVGCSQAEMGYLDMSRQISASAEYQVTGSVEGEIDFDALAALSDQTAEKLWAGASYGSDKNASDEFSEMGLKGVKKIKITYDMLVDMKNGTAFQADFDAEFNGKAYKLGDVYFDAARGVYVSKDFLMGLYDLYKDFSPDAWDSYFYSKEYRDELLKALGDSKYVSAEYLEGMNAGITAQTSVTAMNKEINDAAFRFIETAFSDFTTGAVNPVGGGYKISLDGPQAKKLIADMLQYFIDNTGKVMEAYREYMTAAMKNVSGLTDEEKQAANASFDGLFGKNNQIMFSSALAGVRQMVIEADKAGYMDFLNGFRYEATVKKYGDKFESQGETYLKDKGKIVFSLKSQSELSLQAVKVDFPKAEISLDELNQAIDALENKQNPVKEANITWWNGADSDYDWIDIAYKREKASPFANRVELDYESYFIKEKRLYVPMRSISERLGEAVTWDQKAKKAYVVRGDKQIEMTGIIKDGTTYVKVADFAKLGYQITYNYDKEYQEHSVLISQ